MKDLAEKTFELLEKTGLNWTVKKEPLISEVDGKKTSSFGLFRNDNNAHLGTVKGRYTSYQNFELAEQIIQATAEFDMAVKRGGMLKGGAKVYLQAELPDAYIGKSDMKRWITGLTIHDGSGSSGFGSTNTVVVCENTFYRAYGDMSKFRHTESAAERIKEFMRGMRIALGLEEKLITTYKAMASMTLKEEIFERLMTRLFDVDLNAGSKEINQRKKDKLKKVADAIETEIKLEGNTLWGLFNGITRYTNHVAVKPEKKEEYIMIGKGYNTNLLAYQTIENYLIENKLIDANAVLQ